MGAARFTLDKVVDVREESGRIVVEPFRQKTFDLETLVLEGDHVEKSTQSS